MVRGWFFKVVYHEDVVLSQDLVNKVAKPHWRAAVKLLADTSAVIRSVECEEQDDNEKTDWCS